MSMRERVLERHSVHIALTPTPPYAANAVRVANSVEQPTDLSFTDIEEDGRAPTTIFSTLFGRRRGKRTNAHGHVMGYRTRLRAQPAAYFRCDARLRRRRARRAHLLLHMSRASHFRFASESGWGRRRRDAVVIAHPSTKEKRATLLNVLLASSTVKMTVHSRDAFRRSRSPFFANLPSDHRERLITSMEIGTLVTKMDHKKTSNWHFERRLLLNRETRQLMLYPTESRSSNKNDRGKTLARESPLSNVHDVLVVDLRQVKEVFTCETRPITTVVGHGGRAPTRIADLADMLEPAQIVTILFGDGFILKRWLLVLETSQQASLWVDGLQMVVEDTLGSAHPLVVERWLRKQFYSMVDGLEQSTLQLQAKHLKPFITRLQLKMSSQKMMALGDAEAMSYDAFANAIRKLIYVKDIFAACRLDKYGVPPGDAKDADVIVPFDALFQFLQHEQQEASEDDRDHVGEYIRQYIADFDPQRDCAHPQLSHAEFVDYMFSRENSVFAPFHHNVVQDMRQPLTHYWIASSHNTYLTGSQFRSESSVEAYARSLLLGYRCIELDCWWRNKEVVIRHGNSLTTSLKLRDVLVTIRQYAFVTSDYPIILSFEDHCPVEGQQVIADQMRILFGESLMVMPVEMGTQYLPSPEQLRRKVLIKHKKLIFDMDMGGGSLDDSLFDEDNIHPDERRRAVLKVYWDNCWVAHMLWLLPNKLAWSVHTVDTIEGTMNNHEQYYHNLDQSLDDDDQTEQVANVVSSILPEEMHMAEEWFHASIDRDEARVLLEANRATVGDDIYLVRAGGTFIGDFCISLLLDGSVMHMRIKTCNYEGTKWFFINDNHKKDTLYGLISYHHNHPFTAHDRASNRSKRITLKTPCPQPQLHLTQPWFNGEIGKERAEQLLNMVREDGAYLVRYSTSDPAVFVISWRVDGCIKHMRLKQEGRVLIVNQTVFESLTQMIDYFTNREAFWRGMRLHTPVNEEIATRIQRERSEMTGGDSENYSRSQPEYLDPNNVPGTSGWTAGTYVDLADPAQLCKMAEPYRAIRDNLAEMGGPGMLAFETEADVIVTSKDGANNRWWGHVSGEPLTTGWFSPDAVQKAFDNIRQTDSITMTGCKIEFSRNEDGQYGAVSNAILITVKQKPGGYIRLSADTIEEGEEWYNALVEETHIANKKEAEIQQCEKTSVLSKELSTLVYLKAVKDVKRDHGHCSELCSFTELRFFSKVKEGLVRFNTRQLSRMYPHLFRVMSDNFDPVPSWNAGVHMAALNCQTPDKSCQVHYGKFMANGQCGYILKPAYMRNPAYCEQAYNAATNTSASGGDSKKSLGKSSTGSMAAMPLSTATSLATVGSTASMSGSVGETPGTPSTEMPVGVRNTPCRLEVTVIAGRHLSRKDKSRGIVSPQVTLEMLGMPCDMIDYHTTPVTANGLHPIWRQTFAFVVQYPEVALLRFYVEDGDFSGTDEFIGQAVFPLDACRTGYRSVPLRNAYSEPLELASLLVHVARAEISPSSVPLKCVDEDDEEMAVAADAERHAARLHLNRCLPASPTAKNGSRHKRLVPPLAHFEPSPAVEHAVRRDYPPPSPSAATTTEVPTVPTTENGVEHGASYSRHQLGADVSGSSSEPSRASTTENTRKKDRKSKKGFMGMFSKK